MRLLIIIMHKIGQMLYSIVCSYVFFRRRLSWVWDGDSFQGIFLQNGCHSWWWRALKKALSSWQRKTSEATTFWCRVQIVSVEDTNQARAGTTRAERQKQGVKEIWLHQTTAWYNQRDVWIHKEESSSTEQDVQADRSWGGKQAQMIWIYKNQRNTINIKEMASLEDVELNFSRSQYKTTKKWPEIACVNWYIAFAHLVYRSLSIYVSVLHIRS